MTRSAWKVYEAGVHAIVTDDGLELIRVFGGPSDDAGDWTLTVAKLWVATVTELRHDHVCHFAEWQQELAG